MQQRLLWLPLVAFFLAAAVAPLPAESFSFLSCSARGKCRPSSFVVTGWKDASSSSSSSTQINESSNNHNGPAWSSGGDRRSFLATSTAAAFAAAAATTTSTMFLLPPGAQPAHALGPVKLNLIPTKITAAPCPPSKPIPGEKAMRGMRGLCVTVQADLQDPPPKELSKVGVYGFVTDGETGDSVLANNPDLSTDAGQFAMIELVKTDDKSVVFEFVAAVPVEKDVKQYDNGIGPLNFESLRLISYPGGQQFGAISPCEMNEFSDECAEWEQENGPYTKAEFMVKSNARTMGR